MKTILFTLLFFSGICFAQTTRQMQNVRNAYRVVTVTSYKNIYFIKMRHAGGPSLAYQFERFVYKSFKETETGYIYAFTFSNKDIVAIGDYGSITHYCADNNLYMQEIGRFAGTPYATTPVFCLFSKNKYKNYRGAK